MERVDPAEDPDAARELITLIERSLPPPLRGGATAIARAHLRAADGDPQRAMERVETSVRVRDDGVDGHRFLIERIDAEAAAVLSGVLGVPPGDAGRAIVAACEEAGVPLVAGWDAGARAPVLKLYANATSAPLETRRTVAAQLARRLGVALPDGPPPHLVGANVGASRVELKAYVEHLEHVDALAAARALPPRASALLGRVRSLARTEAAIVTYDLASSAARARAFVVGIAEPRARALALPRTGVDPVVASLAAPLGARPADLERAIAAPRSMLTYVGTSLAGKPTLTAYVRPLTGAGTALGCAPPACRVLVAADVELELVVGPASPASEAFVVVTGTALSYRARRGAPRKVDVHRLMAWAERLVREGRTDDLATLEPPPPWRPR